MARRERTSGAVASPKRCIVDNEAVRVRIGDKSGAAARRWWESAAVDVAIATLLSAAVFVVHPLSFALHHPLWLDEAWVATLARAPWPRAYALSSSTPLGWLVLLRLVPGGRGEQLRLVPMFFSAAAVAAAYVVGRSLPWPSEVYKRVAGAGVGLAVLLAPVSLVRNDLKQYTADAFFALVVVGLANRAEGMPSTRTMGELVVGSIVAIVFSTVAAFVALAVFFGLFCASLAARSKERARTVLIGSAAVTVAFGVYFSLVVVPHTNSHLRAYWNDFYLPSSPLGALSESWHRLATTAPLLGMPVVVVVVLFVAGCITCARMGRPGLAIALVFLWIEMIFVAMVRRYPFLNLRTSQFLLIVSLVLMVVGFFGIIQLMLARWRWIAISIVLVSAAGYLHGALPYVRARWIPNEDVRSATAYVARNRRPGDIIVVTMPSSFGFSYYWPGGRIQYVEDPAVSTGFVTRVSGLGGVVYVNGLGAGDTTSAMGRALAASRSKAGSRIWIIRSHLFQAEAEAWQETFRALGIDPVLKQVGAEPVWVVSGAKPN